MNNKTLNNKITILEEIKRLKFEVGMLNTIGKRLMDDGVSYSELGIDIVAALVPEARVEEDITSELPPGLFKMLKSPHDMFKVYNMSHGTFTDSLESDGEFQFGTSINELLLVISLMMKLRKIEVRKLVKEEKLLSVK